MSTPNEPIVYALTFAGKMLRMFAEDLTPQEMLHRPTPQANCAAWLVGHLALTDRFVLGRVGVPPHELPPLPDPGFERRFSRDAGCPQAETFGDVGGLLGTFEAQRARTIEVARALAPDDLARRLANPHPRFGTVGEVLTFAALHNVMHVGQITIIRRSLGKPPLL